MGKSTRRQLPSDLVLGRTRFRAWRERRKVGARIPQPLWTLAVRLAKAHGLSRTASELGIDYYSLKKRVDSGVISHSSNSPAFVGLPSTIMVGKQCQVELDNGAGATMRVQLSGYDAADVEALARSFWNAS